MAQSAPLSADEQLVLELINRARLDPAAEARRFEIDLNAGLSPGRIGTAPKAVLAPDARLSAAAVDHSDWMLATDTFSHTGAGGSNPGQRAAAAGYDFSGGGSWGENIAWGGTTWTLDFAAEAERRYDGLFRSPGHRVNTLNEGFAEIGLGHVEGRFTSGGTSFNASMLTELFARSGSDRHLTGVAFRDRDGDGFYDIGEGLGGIAVRIEGGGATTATTTAPAGGYGIAHGSGGGGMVAVAVTLGAETIARLRVDLSDGNAKLDVIADGRGYELALSADAELLGPLGRARLLGSGDLTLKGQPGANSLVGNAGDNVLAGRGRADRLEGGDGDDRLLGGWGRDKLFGGAGDDVLNGQAGNDVLCGGAGRDVFVFVDGRDVIRDFDPDEDVIRVDLADRKPSDAGDAGAEIRNGHLVVDFGQGDRLVLRQLDDPDALSDALVLV